MKLYEVNTNFRFGQFYMKAQIYTECPRMIHKSSTFIGNDSKSCVSKAFGCVAQL